MTIASEFATIFGMILATHYINHTSPQTETGTIIACLARLLQRIRTKSQPIGNNTLEIRDLLLQPLGNTIFNIMYVQQNQRLART